MIKKQNNGSLLARLQEYFGGKIDKMMGGVIP
jgi:hypothetical protein